MNISNLGVCNFLNIESKVINKHLDYHLVTNLDDSLEVYLITEDTKNLIEITSLVLSTFEIET